MIQMLRQILEDAIANGASEEQLGRIREAVAAAERAETARNNDATANQQQLEQMLQEQAAMGETFAQGYVAQREEMMNAERALLQQMELLAAAGVEGMEEMAATQRASVIAMEQGGVAADALGDSFDNMMNKMGMNKDLADSVVGKFLIAGPEGFAAIGARMADTLDVQKLFSSGLVQMEKATKQLFWAFDKSQASLAQNTATTGEYNDMLYQVQEQNKSFNVGVEEASAAIADLHNEVSTFNQMSGDQQMMLTETTARMKALGVESGMGAQQFDNLIQGMGMTADIANSATLELVNLGDEIGVAASVISSDFNKAASELAKYGPDAIDVFKGMAAAAKSTGIEVSSLMGITKQFDTFEGAAQSAGKLNAILGGGVVNSMDLLNGTEEERVRLLIQSMSLSGKNFESLNRFEKQAIASAAGISDMTEANKLFSMSLSSYDDMQSKAAGANAEAAKLQERAQAATTFTDKLKQIGQAFAVAFMPVLEFAHGFANIILEINDMTGGIFIPVMLGVVGVLAMLSRVQQLSAIASSVQSGAMFAQTLVTSGLTAANATLVPSTAGVALSSNIATPAVAGLAASFTALLAPAIPLAPVLIALGGAIASIGLAIAAPFLAIAAIVISFTQLFTAMLEAPKAIAAAVAGLLGFAVAGAVALVILAKGMAAAATILVPFAAAMFIVAPALMHFSLAVAVAAGAFYLLAVGIERLGVALQAWKKVKPKSMVMAAAAIGLFLGMLIPLAAPAATVGALVGIPLMLFGMGLQQFAKGLQEFNDVGWVAMFKAAVGIAAFVGMLIAIAAQTATVAVLVGLPLLIFGMGLQQFGKGLQEFNNVGLGAMFLAALSLGIFSAMLIPITASLGITAALVGIPLYIFAVALLKFGEALRAFRKVGLDDMLMAVISLGIFAWMLMSVTVPLLVAATLVGIPLILLGYGLMSFAKGLRKFNSIGAGAIITAVASLFFLAVMLNAVGIPLAFGALLVAIPLILLGKGLIEAAAGIMAFNEVGFGAIFTLGLALGALAWVLGWTAVPIATYGLLMAIPLALVSIALGIFAKALQVFSDIDIVKSLVGIALLGVFAFAIKNTGAQLMVYAPMFAYGLIIASAGLAVFAKALQEFAGLGLDTIFVAIAALMGFAFAMAFLINTGLLAYMIIGFYLLAGPIALFGAGLMSMGMGLLLIAAGMPALMALGDMLSVIAEIGGFGALVFDMLALSIMGIAFAMMLIPESKTIAFGFAMQGYSAAMAAVSALTPESVTAAEKVVESAAEYAEIQATMRMPDEDSFIQAMKNVFGVGEGKDKKQGQDIVLQLNGRELGRAIDAAINSRHNLAVD